jgi:hypothetical protein
MGFKEQYINMKPGSVREALVYQNAIQQSKPRLIPITIPGPNNTKITYQVMPDFLMIDGIRVTLTPPTAQKIANYFGMQIPTAKMADQIYHASNKVPARPLSGTGVDLDGKHYSGNEVVENLISDPRANIAYSQRVDEQISSMNVNPNLPIDGAYKTIVQSEIPGRTSMYGLWTDAKKPPLQGGNGLTPHGTDETEYCMAARFVSNDVVITNPDGTTQKTNLSSVVQNPIFSSTVSHSIDVKPYKAHIVGPPPGYRSTRLSSEDKDEAQSIAKSLLNKPMWTEVTITLSNGKQYIAKIEPHSNAPKGVSLYEASSTSIPKNEIVQSTPKSTTKNEDIMQKLDNFLNTINLG